MDICRDLCKCCLGIVFSLGFSALFLWLSLRTDPPKCSLQSLSLLTENDTVVFQLSLQNVNKDKGVKYGVVLVTFALFLDNTTTRPLANATLLPFYQGRRKTARKWGSAVAPRLLARLNRTAAVKNGNVFLRVEFATRVKYKVWLSFYIKRHHLVGGANVEINASSGEKVEPKAIRLGDVPPRLGSRAAMVRSSYVAVVGVFVTVFFLSCVDG
ncbi:hypothetical protein LR48_Vigan08g078100 [Vigna angularis]|uniref:Late embryogenesis abundant protein LEA-2 subgroup domain-containing protein n=2 Tax=Phaseolus angularis TaxID=3914 RepID=A0A0L9V5L9_PHAAN|nr:protein NDR1 [Vigna angularis]KOM49954.1 hypothetical protein LR48_Vigan08g078100 [Vigna angularis]BAT89911.1 hypothetical protein VIGAN_06104000 [Vigna angularis var. angularis]